MSALTTTTADASPVGAGDDLTDRLNTAVQVRHEIEGRLLLDPDSRKIRTEHAAAGKEVAEARRVLREASEGPWWATAPNPPCRPWCQAQGDHHPGDFARGGALLCVAEMAHDRHWYSIEVQQCSTVNEAETPDVLEMTEPTIWEWRSRNDFADCSLDEVEQYAQTLLAAVEFARKVADQ